MKIYSAQLKGTTTVSTGSNVSLTGSFSGSIYGFNDTLQYSASVDSRIVVNTNKLNNIESKSASVDISISNINSVTSSFSPRVLNLESKSASVDISISNINAVTASNIARLSNLETKSSSVDISITNINSITASNIARLSNLETKSSSVDISITNINSFTASNGNTSLNLLTGSLATTGSNQFYGTQVFSGSVYIANDLVVQGSSSIQYISASSVSIGTNIVQLNTANPSIRFAGLTMIDSGSVGGSGSFLYDSKEDEFLFVHRGNGTNVTSSHFVLGPETYDNLGNELYLTCNVLTKGTGKEHLVDSCIFDNGTTTCIKNNLVGTGTITGTTIFGSTIACSPIGCFATSCATAFIGGTMSGTTIYGSTAVCSPVGKFTTCLDLGGALTGTSATFSGNVGVNITSAYVLNPLTVSGNQMFMGTSADGNTNSVIGRIMSQTRNYGPGIASSSFASIEFVTDGTTYYKGGMRFLVNGVDGTSTAPTTALTLASNQAATFSSTITGTTIYGSTAVCSPIGLFSGCIGIGSSATSPRVLLDIRPANNTGQVLLIGEGGTTRTGFGLDSGTAGMRIFTTYQNQQMVDIGGIASDGSTWTRNHRFGIAGGNSFLNECGGYVGIGTCTPNEKLDVNGAVQVRESSLGYATTQCVGMFDFYTGAARILSFGGSATTCGCFRFYSAAQNNAGGSDVATISGGGVACFRGAVCTPNVIVNTTSDGFNMLCLVSTGGDAGIYLRGGATNGGGWTIQSQNGCSLIFVDRTAGAFPTRMIIASGGNVGIGTVSPNNSLEIQKTSAETAALFINQCNSNEATIRFKSTHNANSDYRVGASILVNSAFEIYHVNCAVNRFWISACGAIMMGTGIDTAINSSDVVHKIGANTGGTSYARLMMQERSGCWISFNNGSGTNYGVIQVSGAGISYGSNSDYRLKTNIQNMASSCGLNRIMCLRPVTFDWIQHCIQGEGFIAHELQEYIPNAVSGEKDAVNETGCASYQSVDAKNIVPSLVKAIQEQQCTINTLKTCLGIA